MLKYIVKGEPISQVKAAENIASIWDEYKQKKFNYGQEIRNQHGDSPLIVGPIELTISFYMPIYPAHKYDELIRTPHQICPSLFSLFNFCEHVLLGIIFNKECQIVRVSLRKAYDSSPRTEISIKRVR